MVAIHVRFGRKRTSASGVSAKCQEPSRVPGGAAALTSKARLFSTAKGAASNELERRVSRHLSERRVQDVRAVEDEERGE